MKLTMFSPNFENRYEITHAISFECEEFYNGVGKFTLVLPRIEYNIKLAIIGSVLYFVERRLAFEVVEVINTIDSSEITIHGYSVNNYLNRRIIANDFSVSNVEQTIYTAVISNLRSLNVAIAPSKGLDAHADELLTSGSELLNGIIPILNNVGLGQRCAFDYKAKTFTFEIYCGVDRTNGIHRVVFSEEQGSATGLVIDEDISEYKNVCFCKATYKSSEEFTIRIGAPDSNVSREMWASFSGDEQQENESDAAFLGRVKQYANTRLNSNYQRIGFNVNIKADNLGTLFDIGDLVCCVSVKNKISFKARITGAKYTMDVNGKTTNLTLGDPTLIYIGG